MGHREGSLKTAAKRTGHTLEEYLTGLEAGLKWCHKCRSWKDRTEFAKDISRGDGLKSICRSCSYQQLTPGPTKAERNAQRANSIAWCSQCQSWLRSSVVDRGICRSCINARARHRYATDARVRAERRQHAHSRERGVDPIPPDAQEMILEEFGGRCAYCSAPATTWDHIVPISEGGKTTPGNIVPACSSCNSSKKNKDIFQWLQDTGRTPHPAFIERFILAECGLYG